MSNVVNKLIFNCLVQYGNVAMPQVGSLEVVAESGSKNNQKGVRFTPQIKDSHIPVTDIIAEQGNLSDEAATAIYNEWLAAARSNEGDLNIEGVGVLTIKGSVAIAEELNKALNGTTLPTAAALPQRKCKHLWLWIWLAILVSGVAIWILTPRCCNSCKQEVAQEVVVAEEVAEPVVEEVVEQPKATPPAANKRYNVAVGVFSIKYNARACAKQDPLGIGAENYTITPFPSGLWVVIAYASDNLGEAERMRREYKKIQPDVWVYRRW
ncbi:MAG: hypothetical protein IIX81_01675 [Tidjanibacter sp.]|nr:hypothetical protein [Tidjanibacter sp.]